MGDERYFHRFMICIDLAEALDSGKAKSNFCKFVTITYVLPRIE